jgi:hypothetical protein
VPLPLVGICEVNPSPLLDKVLSSSRTLRQTRIQGNWARPDEGTLKELAACRIVLVHAPTEQLWLTVCASVEPSTSCVRISTVAQPAAPNPFVSTRGVRVLHLRPALPDVGATDWEAIFESLAVTGDTLRELLSMLASRGLERYFVNPCLPTIESLLVLCEGYLHAPAKNRPETRQSKWWVAPFVETNEACQTAVDRVLRTLENEWGKPSDCSIGPVSELLRVVQTGRLIKPRLVGSARSALTRRLEFARRGELPEMDLLQDVDSRR